MLGHASIVLTGGTYASVLPDVARHTADGIARLIAQAGRYPPGSHAQDNADPRPSISALRPLIAQAARNAA